jgi:hypothetical protein
MKSFKSLLMLSSAPYLALNLSFLAMFSGCGSPHPAPPVHARVQSQNIGWTQKQPHHPPRSSRLPHQSEGLRHQVTETDLERFFESDSRLFGPEIQSFFRVLFTDLNSGSLSKESVWNDARALSLAPNGLNNFNDVEYPSFEAALKVAARSSLRPLLMDAVGATLKRRSLELSRALVLHSSVYSHPVSNYNVVIVGTGPIGSLAAYRMKMKKPDLRLAVLEGDDAPSPVFRNFGLFTWINSPETPTFSTNELVGFPITIKDLLFPHALTAGPYFILPELISDLSELALFSSGADVLLNTEVKQIHQSYLHQGGPIALQVEMNHKPLDIFTDRMLITAGLGRTPHYGIQGDVKKDVGGVHSLPMEEHFDEISRRATDFVRRNRELPLTARSSFLAPYQGKRVAVIGSGDSSNNLIEVLGGYGHPEIYGLRNMTPHDQPGKLNGPAIGTVQGVRDVLWVNQKSVTATECRMNNKPRYKDTVPLAFEKTFCTPMRLVDVKRERHPQTGQDQFTLTLRTSVNGVATDKKEVVDAIWYGTGYMQSASDLVQSLLSASLFSAHPMTEAEVKSAISRLPFIDGNLEVKQNVPGAVTQNLYAHLGRKIDVREIYLGGVSAAGDPKLNPLIPDHELNLYTITKNAASINANAPRAAALSDWIANLPEYRDLSGTNAAPIRVQSVLPPVPLPLPIQGAALGRVVTSTPQADISEKRIYEESVIRYLLGRDLATFVPYRGSWRIEFTAGVGVAFEIKGLAPDLAATVYRQLRRDPDLIEVVKRFLSTDHDSSVCFEMDHRNFSRVVCH